MRFTDPLFFLIPHAVVALLLVSSGYCFVRAISACSLRKVGGIWFLRAGRLFVSFGLSRAIPVQEVA